MHLSAGLALALGRMDWAVNLIAELAQALSGRICGSPTCVKLANSSLAKSTGKTGNPAFSGKAGWSEITGSVLSAEKCGRFH